MKNTDKTGGYITLHPKLGVNPHMTFCTRCGGEANELALIGIRTGKLKCNHCGTINFGTYVSEKCGKCGEQNWTAAGVIEEHERLPATQPCDKCLAELKELETAVAEGGVYFKCSKCATTGVIKGHTKLAQHVREQLKINPPDPCGIEFDDCKWHTPGKEVSPDATDT